MTTLGAEPIAREITADDITEEPLDFSFCSLVTDWKQYEAMVNSMRNAGFDERSSEFLYLDNSTSNKGDGFSGLNRLANAARGRYVIFCHQDLIAIDGPERLRQVLKEVSETDPNWAVVGNAGGRHGEHFFFLNEKSFVFAGKDRQPPQSADTLDEDFLLLRQDARLGFSRDLEGFHLYGTDLVLQAQVRGFSAYVVDFRLEHLGKGAINRDFQDACDRFETKYQEAFATRTVNTTCTVLDIGTLDGKGRQRRHRDFERGLEFVKPSKKAKKAVRSWLSGNRIEVDGLRFQYPKDVTYAAYHALRKGIYERPERNLMKSFLPTDLPVVELGGSYGIVSGLVNRKLDHGVRQIIVEANPHLLDLCRSNAKLGGENRNLTILNCAIDYSGADSITFNVTAGTHDSHVVETWRSADVENSVTAPVMTLSEVLAREKIDGPYSLVCDIEGAEFDLVAKDASGLKNCGIMIVELHPGVFYERGESVVSFVDHLDRAGFEILSCEATVIAARRKSTD